MGEVRKYAHDLREDQNSMGFKNRNADNRHSSLPDMSVHGTSTGSNFYPHTGMGTSGMPLPSNSNMQGVNHSPSKSTSLEKKK
mgnify:CR=1 FL=1